jgi:hypothetical protein
MASVWQTLRPFLFALGGKIPPDAIKMLIKQEFKVANVLATGGIHGQFKHE